MKCWKD